jgi:hypothetical protein
MRSLAMALALGMVLGRLASSQLAAEAGKTRDHQEVPWSDENITVENLISRLAEHDQWRTISLQQYSVNRTYLVKNDDGKLRSETHVLLQYAAPNSKEFKVLSENGPEMIRILVNSLLLMEVEAARGQDTSDSSITSANYSFELSGREAINGSLCDIVQATPRRKDTQLFVGKIWIDTKEFAIVRIAGEPAKRPSFWIKKADFVRQYHKIEGNWLPVKDETIAQVRMFGTNTLTIYHDNYKVLLRENPPPQGLHLRNSDFCLNKPSHL